MTQPSTANDRSFYAQSASEQSEPIDSSAGASHSLNNAKMAKPALRHPNFDPTQTPIDPARTLEDIPEPARRLNRQLQRLYGKSARFYQPKAGALSKWQLMASTPFAEHLDLLRAARLIELPAAFYQQQDKDKPPLLSPLEQMTLLDLSDIQVVLRQYPTLSRYGFGADTNISTDKKPHAKSAKAIKNVPALRKHLHTDELLNSIYADDWQVILQPQDFETGRGSLATDIIACSVAVHALKQCSTRKTINHSYSAAQICQHLRSYILSQVDIYPAQQQYYRQIRLFTGHVIMAAVHLGWDIQQRGDECYFNLSSRCALLTRYANMQDYYINGWSS